MRGDMSDTKDYRKLQAVIEEAYEILSNSADYSPAAKQLWMMLGYACGKSHSKDVPNWEHIEKWNPFDETFAQYVERNQKLAHDLISKLKSQVEDEYRKQGYDGEF